MKQTISTDDIVYSSALKCHGYSLDQITKVGNKGEFTFSDVDDQFIQDYGLGKVLVEPQCFNATLKSLMTSVRRLT